MSNSKRSVVGLSVVSLVVVLVTAPVVAGWCNFTVCANCGAGAYCSGWDAGDCGFYDACMCFAWCESGYPHTYCFCIPSPANPFGHHGDGEILESNSNLTMHMGTPSGNIPLAAFGAAIEKGTGWGVVIVNGANHNVVGADSNGPFDAILADYGGRNGFSVSWDDTQKIITLSGN